MGGGATKFAIAESDGDKTREAVELLGSAIGAGFLVQQPDGGNVAIELPVKVFETVRNLLERLVENRELLLIDQEAELSPEDAAKVLGISRPLVYRRMDDGELQFRQVGAHRRISLRDVLELKVSEDKRRRASKELAEDTDEFEVNYARSPDSSA